MLNPHQLEGVLDVISVPPLLPVGVQMFFYTRGYPNQPLLLPPPPPLSLSPAAAAAAGSERRVVRRTRRKTNWRERDESRCACGSVGCERMGCGEQVRGCKVEARVQAGGKKGALLIFFAFFSFPPPPLPSQLPPLLFFQFVAAAEAGGGGGGSAKAVCTAVVHIRVELSGLHSLFSRLSFFFLPTASLHACEKRRQALKKAGDCGPRFWRIPEREEGRSNMPHSYSGAEEDEELFVGPFRPDMEKVTAKLRNLPTLEGLLAEKDPNAYTDEQMDTAISFVEAIVQEQPSSGQHVEQLLRQLMKKHHAVVKKSLLLAAYRNWLLSDPQHAGSVVMERYFMSKTPRSQSGVLVVTVFTSPYPEGQKFSCKWNCYYCPNEPGQPRSYLLNEPGVRRANRLEFSAYRQFQDRVRSLVAIGHPADKVELLVLGGTWESYPMSYRESFIRDLFYAANTLHDNDEKNEDAGVPPCDGEGVKQRVCPRAPLDLLQEQLLNETSSCRIIGVTLETRPDTVNEEMLQQLRRFGCTRVQLGVQHTDDAVLTAVNRQSTRDDAVRAIKLLKDSCFKVDIHLMPDLPGSTPANDKAMFDDAINSPDLQVDQWKIYPCQTTPFTVIEQWFKDGRYQPYGLENLIDVILYAKRRVQPWVRLNRVIRDIPHDYILGGVEVSNLRQLLALRLVREGTHCRCIRCREVKGDTEAASKLHTATLVERRYSASEGEEVFLSYETADGLTLFGFLRLRLHIQNWVTPFEELRPCALIRELHVYGTLVPTRVGADATKAQHRGVGSMLLQRAEGIARSESYSKIAVISGVGVRNYYRQRGYAMVAHRSCGSFLIKELQGGDTTPYTCEMRCRPVGCDDGSAMRLPAAGDAEGVAGAGSSGLWGYVHALWGRWKRPREERGGN